MHQKSKFEDVNVKIAVNLGLTNVIHLQYNTSSSCCKWLCPRLLLDIRLPHSAHFRSWKYHHHSEILPRWCLWKAIPLFRPLMTVMVRVIQKQGSCRYFYSMSWTPSSETLFITISPPSSGISLYQTLSLSPFFFFKFLVEYFNLYWLVVNAVKLFQLFFTVICFSINQFKSGYWFSWKMFTFISCFTWILKFM